MRRLLVSLAALAGFVALGCTVRVVLAPEETIEAVGAAASSVMPRLPPRRAASAP